MLLPIDVAENYILTQNKFYGLLVFDFCFMMDRILDLFIGYTNKDGTEEFSIKNVIFKNFSSSFMLEIFYVLGPFVLLDLKNIKALAIFLLKIPRLNRLFEIDNAIICFVEYYGKDWTVFERKNIKGRLEMLSFTIETCVIVNFLTCCEIMLCTHRDYE